MCVPEQDARRPHLLGTDASQPPLGPLIAFALDPYLYGTQVLLCRPSCEVKSSSKYARPYSQLRSRGDSDELFRHLQSTALSILAQMASFLVTGLKLMIELSAEWVSNRSLTVGCWQRESTSVFFMLAEDENVEQMCSEGLAKKRGDQRTDRSSRLNPITVFKIAERVLTGKDRDSE